MSFIPSDSPPVILRSQNDIDYTTSRNAYWKSIQDCTTAFRQACQYNDETKKKQIATIYGFSVLQKDSSLTRDDILENINVCLSELYNKAYPKDLTSKKLEKLTRGKNE